MGEETRREIKTPWVFIFIIVIVLFVVIWLVWYIINTTHNEGANIRFASEHDGVGGFGDAYGLPDSLRVSTSSRPGQVRVMRVPVAGGIIQPAILV